MSDDHDRPTSDDCEEHTATVTVHADGERHEFQVSIGTKLRRALLDRGLSPYSRYTDRVNCGGRGLCATCGVRLATESPPTHWHDRLADRFGYPRLSCQIAVTEDLTVSLVEDKLVWGERKE